MKKTIAKKKVNISFSISLLEEINKICDITGNNISSFVRNACMNEVINFWDKWNKKDKKDNFKGIQK